MLHNELVINLEGRQAKVHQYLDYDDLGVRRVTGIRAVSTLISNELDDALERALLNQNDLCVSITLLHK